MQDMKKFKIVRETDAKSKNGIDNIHIETSVKGLIYRCEVYMDSHLIDAEEVNCSEISTIDKYEDIFQARYNVAHRKFEEIYTKKRIYSKVLEADGGYSEDDGDCKVITSICDNIIRCEVLLDDKQIDQQEITIDKNQAVDTKVFKAKYTQAHKDFVTKYIKVLKFPVNTFLNPVLKKFPMYKKSPMYALGFFLATIVLVLWILSIIVCGKAIKKIVTSVAGKQAGMVVKDLQKSMCKKSKANKGEKIIIDANGKPTTTKNTEASSNNFVIIPDNISFKNFNQVYPVYIKNNLYSDVLITLKNRMIFDFSDALVSPDMIINILTDHALHIKAGGVGIFEFKLDSDFLKSNTLEERSYKGVIVLNAISLKTKVTQPITINFDFMIDKDQK